MCAWRADNARFYGASGVPFVMGTTGGDREALMRDVDAAGVSAVIAPQMGKQARPADTLLLQGPGTDPTQRHESRADEQASVLWWGRCQANAALRLPRRLRAITTLRVWFAWKAAAVSFAVWCTSPAVDGRHCMTLWLPGAHAPPAALLRLRRCRRSWPSRPPWS